MNINVSVSVPKKLPVRQLNQFIDRTVYNTAVITLERTEPHIPRLSGHMVGDTLARGVKGFNKSYTLGTDSTPYSSIVWNYPQNTNWTNKKSYSQWFMTEFRNSKEKIISQAVERALKVIR